MRLVTVTGEASGDLIVGSVISTMLRSHPQLEVAGIGGAALARSGMDCWHDSQELAVRGYVEALSRLPKILGIRRDLMRRIRQWRPNVYLGVDAPDFNLGVEALLKGRGSRTVHLISPSIWAWRAERIHKIRQAVDHMLCIFPFEPKIYEGSGVRATYVGHPIADLIPVRPNRPMARRTLGLPEDSRPVIAVLPGSRASEILHNGQSFLGAAVLLSRHAHVVIPASSPAVAALIRQHPGYAAFSDAGARLIEASESASEAAATSALRAPAPISHTVLAASDAALIASGTATLEAALFKIPMVIGYRVPALTYALMRRKALIKDIGLPNILLGSRVVPELVQGDANSGQMAEEVIRLLEDPIRSARIVDLFTGLHAVLKKNASQSIAEILAFELQQC